MTPSLVSMGRGVESVGIRYSEVRAYIFMISLTGRGWIEISHRYIGSNTNRMWI